MTDPVAERIEQQITQRFIAALGVWQQRQLLQSPRGQRAGHGMIKVDCADLITPALTTARQEERARVWEKASRCLENIAGSVYGGQVGESPSPVMTKLLQALSWTMVEAFRRKAQEDR